MPRFHWTFYLNITVYQQYQVKGLKDKCERCLISQLSMDNVIDALVWAAHYNANDLEEEAMEIIIR